MNQMTAHFPLQGGLDLVTPAIRTEAGRVIAGLNYEPVPRGYRRYQGNERYDGRPRPSAASYWVLNFDAGQAAISEGDTVTGATSGATGKALIDAVVTSGGYGGNDAAGYLVLTGVSGTFQDNENLQVSAATKSVSDGTATARGADNDTDDGTWLQDAIETARALISKPAGSGKIRGVWVYGGDTYCFRNNAGGTAGVMYKSTSSGWSQVDLGREIDFDAGTAAFTEGETLTGGTSGATATIKRVIVQSGDWDDNDAAGYLILSGVTGAFQNNETITDGMSGSATSDGADAAITLPAGGRYEFRNHNFYGASNLRRMYGVNGVGKGFEFDGSVFVPIRTGMSTDTPAHLSIHKNHLFYSFAGGSAQFSGTGNPYSWSVVLGAGEIGLGEEITGFLSDNVGVLNIFGRNKVAVLYGNDSDDWVLEFLADDAGGIEWTVQKIGLPTYVDDRGVRTLRTTQAYGDFRLGTITQMVEPIFEEKRKNGVAPLSSVRVRAKDQYRLFWNDGTGLIVYLGRKEPECLVIDFGDTNVEVICSAEDSSGDEVIYFGTNDGWVMQMDRGTSFDGSAISAFIRLPFNHIGSPTQNKRWHKATLEADVAATTSLSFTVEYGYANPHQPPSIEQSFSVTGSGGFWDESDDWDDFYWDSAAEGTAEANIDGFGTNMSLAIISEATYEEPHTLHGLTLHFSYRGLAR